MASRIDRSSRPAQQLHGPARLSLLDVAEIARRCQISQRQVRRWIARGELPVIRLGRIVRVMELDLEHFLLCRRGLAGAIADVIE